MRCEHCGKKLAEGTEITVDKMCIGAYCNIICWAQSKGQFKTQVLTEDMVFEEWGLKKWDSDDEEE